MEQKYTAKNIQLLEGIEHVRKRPSMYIGDTGSKGLHHLIYEIIDNSIDESLAGFCNKIWVILKKNNYITVIDNGRGIPIDIHEKENKSALEVVMTKIGAGGKFDNNSYKVSGGLHGVGLSCVNALSAKLVATIYKDGYKYIQKYSKGVAITKVIKIKKTKKQGTKISFQPDNKIFKHIEYSTEIIQNRLRELAFLNKGVFIFFADERNNHKNTTQTQIFHSKIGLKDFILYMDDHMNSINYETIYIDKKYQNINIEIAIKYNDSFNESIFTYVNNINTKDGGTHLTGFRRALTRSLKKYIEEKNKNLKQKIETHKNDFKEGLNAIISIKMPNPQFEGQTKNKLSNTKISGIVDKVVGESLNNFLQENPHEAKKIINKIIIASKARRASIKAKELIQKKETTISSPLPGKLSDCSLNNPKDCEIYLVEGDSAGGTAKQGRNREFQAILPLKGKIINVEKSMIHKTLENEEIKNIFSALGVYFEVSNIKELNIDKLRYNKIIIMTDADIDGSHISTLILTFFFRYMYKLIENGYLYIATPPLYLIKTNKQQKYAWNDEERDSIIQNFKNKNILIQRYKGLGEMNADQLWETTMNPKNRTLKQIKINDFKTANKTFSMLMGEDVVPRKEFIEKNALYANLII